MKPRIKITAPNDHAVVLCSATWEDQESLRAWKNANRQYFFFKNVIERDGQHRWFEGHLRRPDDHMFMVIVEGKPIGCLAVRVLGDELDIYNVILGDERFSGKGYMTRGIRMMAKFAFDRYPRRPLRLKVLKNNPAVRWYERNGFHSIGGGDDYLELEFNGSLELPQISVLEER
ncbi:MAG TPA: GNAT family N-acetyltransferase [Thermoanaerobaculia bacterium]|nr:GNAT family N-acetyltransferase [Thermoanaerobaculia bacterium]